MFHKRHSKSRILVENILSKISSPIKNNFKRTTSSSIIENYITYLADTIKKRTTELTSYNPLKKINPELLIDLTPQTYEAIYYILSKLNRTYDELLIIKVYLSTIQKFLKVLNVKQGVEQLLFSLSVSLKCEKKQENSIVFRYGELGAKCYILLIGCLSILLPKENYVNLTFLVYFKHLILLYLISEDEILKKTIANNKGIFHIDENEIENIIIYIKKCLSKNIPFSQIKILNFDLREVTEIITYFNKIMDNLVNKNMKHYCSVDDYIKYTYLYENEKSENFEQEELVTIYSYFEIIKKNKGDIFGEVALQNEDKKRTATIICYENCVFGSLSKSAYNNCLRDIEVRKRRNYVNFILSFPIFTEMRWNIFESRYFNFFKLEQVNHGDVIIKQNEVYEKVYFIKEGQFQLNSLLSANDLSEILKEKRKIIFKPKDKYFNNEKKQFRITIINNKDVIGLEDICFKNHYLVDAVCISTEALIFSITKNILNDISNKIPEVKLKLENTIKFREKIITERLLEIYKNTEKNYEEELRRIKLEEQNNLKSREDIFKDAIKPPELGKRNKLKSAKTKIIFKNDFTLSLNKSYGNNSKNNSNNNIKEKIITRYSSNNKLKNRNFSISKENKKSRNLNLFNSPITTSSFRNYIKVSNEISNLGKLNSGIPSLKYTFNEKKTKFNTHNDLKKIIGSDYEENKESNNEKKFSNFLVNNKNSILGRNYKGKSLFHFPTVDLLYYDNHIKLDKKKENEKENMKKKKKNLFHKNIGIQTASSFLLNYSNFNKSNIFKNNNFDNNIKYNNKIYTPVKRYLNTID